MCQDPAAGANHKYVGSCMFRCRIGQKLSRHSWPFVLFGGLCVAGVDVAWSAEPPDVGTSALEEVTVTARRRDESAQRVPVAITVLTADQLYARGVTSLEQMRLVTPSLQVAPSPFGASVPGYTLRGQRQLESIATQDPSVVVYFAEVPVMRPHGTAATFFDVDSIQVLKGPQGTLFGRNTTGGAILVSPARPTARLEGSATLKLGNYGLKAATGVLNLPLGETFSVRVAATGQHRDGYTKNLADSRRVDDDDTGSVRLSALWNPTEALENLFSFQLTQVDNGGQGWRLLQVNPMGAIGSFPAAVATLQQTLATLNASDWHTVSQDVPTRERVDTWFATNTTSLKLGAATLRNIAGYRDIHTDTAFDYDGSTARIVGAGTGSIGAFNSQNSIDGTQFSDELQLLGTAFDERLDWIFGGFYFKEDVLDDQRSDLFGRRANTGTGRNRSTSLFAQGTYRFRAVEGLSATAGYRYTWDDRELFSQNQIQGLAAPALGCRLTNAQGVPLNPCARTSKFEDSADTYTLGLEYQANERTLLYATHRHGYRSGGLQLRSNAAAETPTFRPEFVDDIELGLKSTLSFGRSKLRFDLAVFDQSYEDIQRTLSFVPAPGQPLATLVLNAGEATIRGGELQATLQASDALEVSAFVGYTNADYKRFDNPGIAPATLAIPNRPLADNDFALVPRSSGGATVRYTLPLPGSIGELALQANWYRQAQMQMTDINDPGGVIPAYSLVGVQADWRNVLGRPLDLRLYVDNAADEDYSTGGSSVWTTGFTVVTLGAPRTFGIEARYRFGD